jgi:hypothetical protein
MPPKVQTTFQELNRIVSQCLAKNPDHRFFDFQELRGVLEECIFNPRETYLRSWHGSQKSVFSEGELLDILRQLSLRDHNRALAALSTVAVESSRQDELVNLTVSSEQRNDAETGLY